MKGNEHLSNNAPLTLDLELGRTHPNLIRRVQLPRLGLHTCCESPASRVGDMSVEGKNKYKETWSGCLGFAGLWTLEQSDESFRECTYDSRCVHVKTTKPTRLEVNHLSRVIAASNGE